MAKQEHYLKNKEILRNIHLSKASFTWYIDGTWRNTKFLDYDFIACADDLYYQCREQLMLQIVNNKRIKKNKRRTSVLKESDMDLLTSEDFEYIDNKIVIFNGKFDEKLLNHLKLGHYNRKLYENGNKRVNELPKNVEIDENDLVLRVFTYEHIPYTSEPRKNKKHMLVSDYKEKVNFPPYKHYAIVDGQVQCVALSHYNSNKEFDVKHGKINDGLGLAFMKLTERISKKHNWRDYSYIDEMITHALVQLSSVGLQFNELFSSNPFSYYTTVINNAFTVVFNSEKDNQQFRDELLMKNGHMPSSTKQYELEESRSEYWDNKIGKKNMAPSEVVHIDPSNYNSE
ncbi:hypothetical protein PBI_SCTP2_185 [Salicola phage SCTP-2]|nr:hypothetical protein PBI_SCTP2_185 [Salicola phage SCTP-2]